MMAIILAAGRGTRLAPLTDDRPKCLVELAGRSLLDYQAEALGRAGIEDIMVLGGYRRDMIEKLGFKTIENPEFASTNMVVTLFHARDLMNGTRDIIIGYGDIVYRPEVVKTLINLDAAIGVIVDHDWLDLWRARMEDPLADAETLKMDPDGRLREIGAKPTAMEQIQGQYIGLIKVRADTQLALVALYDDIAAQSDWTYRGRDLASLYMTDLLQILIDLDWTVMSASINGGWLEVDTVDDLEIYEKLHAENRLTALGSW